MTGQESYSQGFAPELENRNYLQRRLANFSLTMIVMGASLFLYYLGLFGNNVEGPLQPAQLGERLVSLGVTKTHMLVFFSTVAIIAITWNWIFNFTSLAVGSRLTCVKKSDDETLCGLPARRKKVVHKKTGRIVVQYICQDGHKCRKADFHPVKKGTISQTLWVISLLFSVTVFYLS